MCLVQESTNQPVRKSVIANIMSLRNLDGIGTIDFNKFKVFFEEINCPPFPRLYHRKMYIDMGNTKSIYSNSQLITSLALVAALYLEKL